jgi:hypothetical protein
MTCICLRRRKGGALRWETVGWGMSSKGSLLALWCCTGNLDGWSLQLEGCGLLECACCCVLDTLLGVVGIRGVWVVGMAWWRAPSAIARREWAKAGSVWCGLRAELSKIEIGSSTVTDGHGLAQTTLGVVAVKDDTVDGDGQRLDDDFNDAADESPVLFEMLV